MQWRRQDFVTGGEEVRYGSIGGLEYEVPQSRLYCLCINVALCSTALQCICRVIRRSFMTMKAHTYCIIFGRPPIGGSFPPPPWRRHWLNVERRRCQRAAEPRVSRVSSLSTDEQAENALPPVVSTPPNLRPTAATLALYKLYFAKMAARYKKIQNIQKSTSYAQTIRIQC